MGVINQVIIGGPHCMKYFEILYGQWIGLIGKIEIGKTQIS